jgi:hypothetical protein
MLALTARRGAFAQRKRPGVIVGLMPCKRFIQVTVGIPSGFQNGADGAGERNPDVSNK